MEEIKEIYKTYARDIYRYSYFKLQNRADAEDVTSETFLRAINKNIIPNKEKLFLIGIARNIIYEKFKADNKVQIIVLEENINLIDTESSNLDDKLIKKEHIDICKRELNKLDPKISEILILKIWEDLTFEEIAHTLNSNTNSVKTKYYRGLEEIKQNIEKNNKQVKLHTFTLPILIKICIEVANSKEYQISKSAMRQISSIFINKSIMGKIKLLFMKPGVSKILIITLLTTIGISSIGLATYIWINKNKGNSKEDNYAEYESNKDQENSENEKTLDWPTYQSKNYKFSFKYRPDLQIDEDEKSIFLKVSGESFMQSYDNLFTTFIYVIDNPNRYSPEEYAVKELCKDFFTQPGLGLENITINYCLEGLKDNLQSYQNEDLQGIKTEYNLFENPTIAIIFPFEDKLILVESIGETGGLPTDLGLETLDLILSTFKF